ncbi:hypothetical protein C3942_20265 [Solimonas fluminis]|uniref:HTH araC/xylS-type domain-containing protein n=1 Tax=Solimonas fluminis TaxID=2086571 RepID=A0A2S5TAL1_9GAMM|nr:AraC family transcriptional regulator ligand-binding domain-containing protein [Solimonas fluminis]PPE72034.1 hypothetical protein C3942_20265 [Solimonas fluminis]
MGSADLPTSFRPLEHGPRQARDLGVLGEAIAMAPHLHAALRSLAAHAQAWMGGLHLCLETLPDDGRRFLLLEPAAGSLAGKAPATEQALATISRTVAAISGGQLRPCEAWFSHEALAPLSSYRAQFGAALRFGQGMDGLVFDPRDLDQPLPGQDAQGYDAAMRRIGQQFPALPPRMGTRVRIIVTHLLAAGGCTHDRVSAALGLHPRTLQRRLREEGESFEAIKDRVRRDVALRHLGQSDVSLVRMTEILGYSETSVLTRSCQRWFSASPRQLRKHQRRRPAQASPCAT